MTAAMKYLSDQKNTIFLGQATAVPGTIMFNTLSKVKKNKIIEFPVAEEMQMGVTLGLSLNGYVPVSLFPRQNFLLLALNQLVNHLDKLSEIAEKKNLYKFIIRTSIGSERPLNPQHQHIGDFSEALSLMCTNIEIIVIHEPKNIFKSYKKAYNRKDGKSTLLIEYGDYFNEK